MGICDANRAGLDQPMPLIASLEVLIRRAEPKAPLRRLLARDVLTRAAKGSGVL